MSSVEVGPAIEFLLWTLPTLYIIPVIGPWVPARSVLPFTRGPPAPGELQTNRAFGPTDSRGAAGPHMGTDYSQRKDDFGMKQGAGDPGRDGQQVALSEEDFDLAGAGEFGKVDRAAAANARGGGFVRGNGGELWKELAWVDKKGFDCSSFSCVRVGGGVECRHVVVDKRDGGRDS